MGYQSDCHKNSDSIILLLFAKNAVSKIMTPLRWVSHKYAIAYLRFDQQGDNLLISTTLKCKITPLEPIFSTFQVHHCIQRPLFAHTAYFQHFVAVQNEAPGCAKQQQATDVVVTNTPHTNQHLQFSDQISPTTCPQTFPPESMES